MEDHLILKRNLVHGRPEKSSSSFADLRQEITEKGKNISPEHRSNHRKQFGKEVKGDELVKYMSRLPSYLERGENHQEKFLNVGVLDWGRLEKWQHQNRQILQRTSRHSVSSSKPFSSFSTDGSSACSSSSQSCSPSRQRMRRPTLQDHLMSSHVESDHLAVKSSKENISKSKDDKNAQMDTMNEQGKFMKTVQPLPGNHLEMKIDQCERYFDPKIDSESLILDNGIKDKALQQKKAKGKARTQDGQFANKMEDPIQRKADVANQDVHRKSKTNALFVPRDLPQTNHSEVPYLDNLPMVSDQVAVGASRRSFSEMPEEIGLAGLSSDVPHSCPLPCELDRCLEIKNQSIDSGCWSILQDPSQSVTHPVKKVVAPFRSRIPEFKKPIVNATNASNDPSAGPDQKRNKAAVEKGRSTSPFRRLSIGMTKISKSFSSKEVLSAPQSTHSSGKFGSMNSVASLCHNNSSGDTQSATSRARTSPLRRLLDPLLKPKVSHCQNPGELLNRDSKVRDTSCKSSNSKPDFSAETARWGKERLGVNCRRESNIDASQDIKRGSSTLQALLRVAIKNGQPLFTFAVDNESDILAATMKKLSTSREDDYSCIYTFFAFQEVKRKNGRWINQGGEGKCHDYIPNVVAQLKVYGSQFSNLSRQNFIELSFAREFVLFAVDLQQLEQQPLEFQPNNELAAIVIKIPKVISRSAMGDDFRIDKCNNYQETRFSCTFEEDAICSQSLLTATVILPSGTHSLPSKGGPSSLIQRWRSGGSCDCGGWDLGCELRILVNQNKLGKKTSSSKALDKFEFITQGREEESRPVFSLSPFKDGIYSVEFNSSLSILQAFSLCIAVLDTKKLCESSDSSNLFEEETSLESMLAQNDGRGALNGGNYGDGPARYVSYPPLSPVGRV